MGCGHAMVMPIPEMWKRVTIQRIQEGKLEHARELNFHHAHLAEICREIGKDIFVFSQARLRPPTLTRKGQRGRPR